MDIEVVMNLENRQSEMLKDYADRRMVMMKQRYPKVSRVVVTVDFDERTRQYTAEVIAERLGHTAVGATEFSRSGKGAIEAAASRAERQLLKLRMDSWRETVLSRGDESA